MRKSDQKKLNAAKKGESRQQKHKARLWSAGQKKEAKHQAAMDRLFRKFDRQRQTDGLTASERDAQIKDQLHRNMEILEALEQQMNQEQADRAKINAELESQGFSSLEEKMEHLQKQVAEQQRAEAEETNFGMGGSAECGVGPANSCLVPGCDGTQQTQYSGSTCDACGHDHEV